MDDFERSEWEDNREAAAAYRWRLDHEFNRSARWTLFLRALVRNQWHNLILAVVIVFAIAAVIVALLGPVFAPPVYRNDTFCRMYATGRANPADCITPVKAGGQ